MTNRYDNTAVEKKDGIGSMYYTTTRYPDIPLRNTDYYVITTIGDRLDLLALDFYNDASLWWVIASANALPGDSIYPPIGMQLRIPRNVQSIIASYKLANNG